MNLQKLREKFDNHIMHICQFRIPLLVILKVPHFTSCQPSSNAIPANAIESAGIKEISSKVVVNFFAVFSTLIYKRDETSTLTYYFIDSDRIYSQRKSNHLCCCRFSSLTKVSSTTEISGLLLSNVFSPIDHHFLMKIFDTEVLENSFN